MLCSFKLWISSCCVYSKSWVYFCMLYTDNSTIPKVIVDDRSSVNVIPLSTWEQIGKLAIIPPHYSIKLVDESIIHSIGTIQNVPVTVEGVTVYQEFTVVGMTTNTTYPTLLGRQ
eukprot:Gb_07138 [translate_table: standard]